MTGRKYDRINFIYRSPSSIYSPYMFFEGLKSALERNGLLHYAFDVTGTLPLDLDRMFECPILCITGSSAPLVELVSRLHGRQFIAEICPESLHTRSLELKQAHYDELREAARLFDLYLTPVELDLQAYWGKPCYWLPSWAHTELLGDHYPAVVRDRIGFIGQRSRREDFFSSDRNGILLPGNTPPRATALDNLIELCRAINGFAMLVNPESDYVSGLPGKIFEIMACNRLCFSQLNEESMFKSKLLFRDDQEVVYFATFEELEAKFRYYAGHGEALERVALAGFRKVRHLHSADVRARQIAERVLHHANGGGYREDLNEVAAFAGPEPAALSRRARQPVAKPFMQDFEVRAIGSALQLVKYGTDVLEWGSGNSTLYFSRYLSPESRWVAVEHDEGWAREVRESAERSDCGNVSVFHVPPDGPFNDGVEDGTFDAFYSYVMMPRGLRQKFGAILVDGRARVACLTAGWGMLRDDGIMVLHDAQRPEYQEGLPADGFFLKIQHRQLENNGQKIATLFMARRPEVIAALKEVIDQHDPSLTVESEFPPRAARERSRPSILFINTYYSNFLSSFYAANPSLAAEPYQRQKAALAASLFGDSDFYSTGMAEAGWSAEDCIVNCLQLQRTWAVENRFSGTPLEVAVEQVRRSSPDVLYIQDLNICNGDFLHLIRPHTRLIVGQIASPIPASADLGAFDILVSSFPHFVERFRKAGLTSYYQPLAFDPRVLRGTPRYQFDRRPVDCAFIGGFSPMHGKANELMEHLANELPIHFWGYGAERLPAGSAMASRHQGEVWGREMFKVLASTRIALNRHIDVAENHANNMRLFEATGCGALLVTDYKDNLGDLFEIGKEVVAYRTPDECSALVRYYLANPGEAEAIARAGQERTLRDHAYGSRMAKTAEILERQLRYREEKGKYPLPQRVSDGHQAIAPAEVTPAMTTGWQDPAIPARQRGVVQRELEEMYRGKVPAVFSALAGIMKPVTPDGAPVLEIGCASGYYNEVLEYLLNRRLDYTGVDYSEAMIAMAKDYYPQAAFFAADGASLFFADRSFHTVISSCILLHVPNYRDHIMETARVARDYIVAARTPVCRKRPTQYLKKFAYGVVTVELVYNEAELLREFALNRFRVRNAIEYGSDPDSDCYLITYLLQRV